MTQDIQEMMAMMFQNSDLPSENKSRYWLYEAKPGLQSFYSNDKTGKWCIFVSRSEVDEQWSKIKQVIKEGKLLVAKVSTAASLKSETEHVVCVYTEDWSDKEELKRTRQVLKEIGFESPLGYKRDIETKNRVYGSNSEFYVTM